MKDYLSDRKDIENFEKRISEALTTAHFLANVVGPRHQGKCLNPELRDIPEKYVCECFPDFLPTLMSFRGGSKPFKDFYFGQDVLQPLSPLASCHNFSHELPDNVMNVPR